MVIRAGHSQSHWRRSCSSRRQFGQIGSCKGSSLWRYCFNEGWWPDLMRARRLSSCLLFICFVSRETLRRWYTAATRSCFGGASRNISLITWLELDIEMGRIGFVVCGCFFGCFVRKIVTWDGRMARDPLDKYGRWYGVNGTADGTGSRSWMSRIVRIPWQQLPPQKSW